jgi:hypothetical protein
MTEQDPFDGMSDDPLVRALRGPGSPDELAGLDDALAAYRGSRAGRRRGGPRRALRRVGTGAGAVVLTVSLGGGVAAAYTETLPTPVQGLAHSVLGPVGVPAPDRRAPERAVPAPLGPDTATAPATTPPTSPPTGSTSPGPDEATRAEPGEETSPDPSPGRPSPSTDGDRDGDGDGTDAPGVDTPRETSTAPTPAPTEPAPTEPPTGPPTTGPTPTPEPEPGPAPVPAAVSVEVSATRVAPGTVVTVAGVVTDATGQPVADRRVRLAYRTAGGTWTTYDAERTGTDGSVEIDGPALTVSVATRLVVGRPALRGVRSEKVRVLVQPVLSATATDGRVDITATGGQPGDPVVLTRRNREGRVVVARAVLSVEGTASFTVGQGRRDTTYGVRLERTRQHLGAGTRVVVAARTPGPPAPEE